MMCTIVESIRPYLAIDESTTRQQGNERSNHVVTIMERDQDAMSCPSMSHIINTLTTETPVFGKSCCEMCTGALSLLEVLGLLA